MITFVLLISLVGSCLLFAPGLVAAVVARHKGYRPWFWLLSFGPVGMIWILLKPNLRQATTPEERERWETSADWTGGVLSGFAFFLMFGFPMIAVLGFFSMRLAPPPPMPLPIQTTKKAEVLEIPSDTDAPQDRSDDWK